MLCGLVLAGLAVTVTAGDFTSTLSTEDLAAAGLTRLTEGQLASLNAQIESEIAVARQLGTPAPYASFTHRRSPQQRKDAGLDQLMTLELRRLDELASSAFSAAAKPAATGPSMTQPATTPASLSDWLDARRRRMEVHGEITLAYMWGSGGRSGYGAEFAATMTDPSGKFSATIVVSRFHSKMAPGRGANRLGPMPFSPDILRANDEPEQLLIPGE